MDTAATFDQFTTYVKEDERRYFSKARKTETPIHKGVGIIDRTVLRIDLLVLAQFAPSVFKKHLAIVTPFMPYIEDKEKLVWLRDAFLLYYQVLKDLRPMCFRRKTVGLLMDELDEHIDSLSFVLENEDFLKHALEGIEHAQ